MAVNLIGLDKLGITSPGASRKTAQTSTDTIPAIAPVPPTAAEQDQINALMGEQEREKTLSRPGVGWTGTGGQVANVAAAFLHGIAQGRATGEILKYQKIREQGNNLATAYGMARSNLLPLESEAYQHRVEGNNPAAKFIPELGFAVDSRWFASPEGLSWAAKYKNAYNATSATRQSYVNYIQQSAIPETKGTRRHRSTASNVVHKAEEIGLNMLRGGPQIPEGYTEAAAQIAQQLPIGHTPEEVASYGNRLSGITPYQQAQLDLKASLGQAGLEQKATGQKLTAEYHNRILAEREAADKASKATTITRLKEEQRHDRAMEQLERSRVSAAPVRMPPAYASQLTTYRDELTRNQSAVTTLEGKLAALQSKQPGAISEAKQYIDGLAGYPVDDPVATAKQMIADHKAHQATLQLQIDTITQAATNPGTPEQQREVLERAANITAAPQTRHPNVPIPEKFKGWTWTKHHGKWALTDGQGNFADYRGKK